MNMTDIKQANILLTGLPRSGTTLTCSLLNKLPDCVALHEPMSVHLLAKLEPAQLIAEIGRFINEQRANILRKGTAASKSWQGRVPTNSMDDPDKAGVRKSLLDGRKIEVANVTGPDFSIFVKHPAFFTAALQILVESFACYALVRNPLSVLVSWKHSGMPIGEGRMPVAETFDPALAAALAAEPDTLERQFILLDYCFNQYRTHLPGRILRYEDIVASGGKALVMLHPAGGQLDEPLRSRNTFFLKHDRAGVDIAKRLLRRDSPCWDLYDRASIETMIG
jgi:hypothetical protein